MCEGRDEVLRGPTLSPVLSQIGPFVAAALASASVCVVRSACVPPCLCARGGEKKVTPASHHPDDTTRPKPARSQSQYCCHPRSLVAQSLGTVYCLITAAQASDIVSPQYGCSPLLSAGHGAPRQGARRPETLHWRVCLLVVLFVAEAGSVHGSSNCLCAI
jgi:hypothetical protein